MIRTISIIAACLGAIGAAQAQPIERVIGIEVHNGRAQIAALDQLFASDAMSGQKATLWAAEFDGSSPSDRTLVIHYDDYADLQARGERVGNSHEWLAFQHAIDGSSKTMSSRLAVQRVVQGSGWENHGTLVAFSMSVSDPATYLDAFNEMIRSTDNPGSIRLMEMRYGGEGVTHVALLSAPDFTTMNEYLDDFLASDEYRRFVRKVRDIREIKNIASLRRIKSWGN